MLTPRALNRALLARQMLLERRPMAVGTAIEHLVGMQAQAPLAPYVGLWSRLDGFRAADLADEMTERRAVRASLMRSTIHLVTDRDALALRSLVQPVLERNFRNSPFARHIAGIDRLGLLAAGRAFIEERPRTRAELAPVLAERWPGPPANSLVYAVTYLVPVVQVPPRGVWGRTGPPAWTTTEAWLGRPLEDRTSADEMVLRYLAAFGPATVMDIGAWSGLTRLRAVVERLRPNLATFRDDHGRELFDLPDAPRPDEDVPAPPRFLPEYDNVLLGHADRTRILPPGRAVPLPPGNGAALGSVLIDGLFGGTWRITRDRIGATLTIDVFERVGTAGRNALGDEGARLIAFAAAEVTMVDIVVHASTS